MKTNFLILMGTLAFSSCMKDSFDAPANIADPNLTVNYSIGKLKADYKMSGQVAMSIANDYIISGIITADDQSSNFYKEIVIQDSTSAIGIKIDRSNLYNDFPIGRRVFVNLKGMAVGSYNSLIQLGGYIDTVTVPGSKSLGAIPSGSISKFLIKGSLGHTVTPVEVAISDLNDDYQYKLVTLKKLEVDCADINSSYADAISQNDASRTLNDCLGKSIFIRNSGFANFAAQKLPKGNGSVTAIYSVYKFDKQLKIRDLNDVKIDSMTARCVSCSSPGGGGTSTLYSISDLRALYAGNGVKLDKIWIEGTVISDLANKNIDTKNMIIQDATGGVVIRFTASHSFGLGDKVKVSFTGDSLIKYRGLMEADKIPSSAAIKLGTGTIIPATATISAIKNDMNKYESTLVKIVGVTLSGGSTFYSGTGSGSSRKLTDNTSNIDLWTMSGATFATSTMPTGTRTVTCIIGLFTSPQVSIRNANDIQ